MEWHSPTEKLPDKRCLAVIKVGAALVLCYWELERFWEWGMPGSFRPDQIEKWIEIPPPPQEAQSCYIKMFGK